MQRQIRSKKTHLLCVTWHLIECYTAIDEPNKKWANIKDKSHIKYLPIQRTIATRWLDDEKSGCILINWHTFILFELFSIQFDVLLQWHISNCLILCDTRANWSVRHYFFPFVQFMRIFRRFSSVFDSSFQFICFERLFITSIRSSQFERVLFGM